GATRRAWSARQLATATAVNSVAMTTVFASHSAWSQYLGAVRQFLPEMSPASYAPGLAADDRPWPPPEPDHAVEIVARGEVLDIGGRFQVDVEARSAAGRLHHAGQQPVRGERGDDTDPEG